MLMLVPCAARASEGGHEHGLGLVSAIGLAIIAASVLMLVFNALKLPALLAYIVSGLVMATVAGPLLGDSIEIMSHVSHLGLVFLLFIIGLEMDLRGILNLGTRTAMAVLLQAPIAIAAVLGLQFAANSLGVAIPGLGTQIPSFFYFAVACSLGSTAVVVKLLGDKFDLDSKAGKITVLTLIAQDIWAVLALSYVASMTGGEGVSIVLMLGGGLGAGVVLVLFSRYVMSRIMTSLAKSPDLMALVSIGWCFLCAQAFSLVGLSAEMGALVAGLTVGALPYHVEVLAKVSSLRDFFMALFFVALGMTLPMPSWNILLHALVLVLIVILVRLVLFTPTLFLSRLGPIVSFTVPINLAQISEFTLLLVPLGIAGKTLTTDQGAVISYGLMLSVVVTSFAVAHNYRIARLISRLVFVQRAVAPGAAAGTDVDASPGHGERADIVMLGFFINAEALTTEIKRTSPDLLQRILVIDYNLQNHNAIVEHGLRVAYGDISNPETLRHHGIAGARVVLSTISNTFLRGITNQDLADRVKHINPDALFIATADDERGATDLLGRGVFRAVVPPAHAAPVYMSAISDALSASDSVDRHDRADPEERVLEE